MSRNHAYWTETDYQVVKEAQTFQELAQVALAVLARMPQPIGQVCGPISTGGLGSVEANLVRFNEVIDDLIAQGNTIFDQVPFEEPMFKLKAKSKDSRNQDELLEKFYLPIFESGFIATLYFIPGWESSYGAQWEHDQAQRFNIPITYL